MSTVKTNNVQIGQSLTASQNFTWYQPASPDGTVRLGNGNSGSVTDLVTLTSAGNLGIGTSSPAQTLHVKTATGGTPITLGVLSNATGLPALSFNGAYASTTMAGIYGNGASASNLYYTVPASQNHYFAIADSTKMTLDSSGNLGIGTSSPNAKLQVSSEETAIGGANFYGNILVESTTTAAAGVGGGIVFSGAYSGTTTTQGGGIKLLKSNGTAGDYSFGLGFYTRLTGTSGALQATLDSSGNLGLGVTPSAWRTDVSFKALQLPGGSFTAYMAGGVDQTPGIAANGYVDSGGTWRYINSRAASWYIQNGGMHAWYTAPSGTAGAAISFTQAMTLDASGNLILNVGEYIRITGTTISVGTSATAITGAHSFGSTAIVRGINGGQIFGDLVFFSDSVVTVLASHGVSGGPAARTYTAVGGVLKLAMASGTYSVNVGITTVV